MEDCGYGVLAEKIRKNELKEVQVRLPVKHCYSCRILMVFIIVPTGLHVQDPPHLQTQSIHAPTNRWTIFKYV